MKTFRDFLNESKVNIEIDYHRDHKKYEQGVAWLYDQKKIDFKITTDTIELSGDKKDIREFLKTQIGMSDTFISSEFKEL